ncbi:hypothetical protein BGX28_001191 [Mortierella sp. GBA30]|nr:hypothetical protein BGX28_001191 [Mortierella sp. GBA30]
MPLLKSYLDRELTPRDRAVLSEIIAVGIKTDASLVLDPNAIVAKTSGRISKTVIDSLLDRIILPMMLGSISSPKRASDMFLESASVRCQNYMSTGWERIDQLLSNQGWVCGEVSEICGTAGVGKTQMCLNAVVTMLVNDPASQAIWIDTLDGEFSAQRASEIIQVQLARQAKGPESAHSSEELSVEGRIMAIISRIQVYACHDAYELLTAIESVRRSLEEVDTASALTTRLVVIDSLSTVLTELLRGTDGAGHATMMHTSRELRELASDFNLAVLVTTLSVQLSHPEEQAPSILMTSTAKPGLGTSWRYGSDLQLYLTRLVLPLKAEDGSNAHLMNSGLFGEDESEDDTDGSAADRLVEIMRSKRLVGR